MLRLDRVLVLLFTFAMGQVLVAVGPALWWLLGMSLLLRTRLTRRLKIPGLEW